MDLIKDINLMVRFLLELGTLAAVGYVGWHAGGGLVAKFGFATGAPVVVAIVWGMLVAPNASVDAPRAVHLLLQVAIFGGAALALARLGHRTPATSSARW